MVRWGGRIVAERLLFRGQMTCVLSVYAPQTGRMQEGKDVFRSNLLSGMWSRRQCWLLPVTSMLVVAGDMNVGCGR